jgi:hypothetical protein
VLDAGGPGIVGEVVLEGEVDDAVGGCRSGGEAAEVVEAAAVGGGALGVEGRCRLVGAGEAEDFVAVGEELIRDSRADPAGCAGDEDAHSEVPFDG